MVAVPDDYFCSTTTADNAESGTTIFYITDASNYGEQWPTFTPKILPLEWIRDILGTVARIKTYVLPIREEWPEGFPPGFV